MDLFERYLTGLLRMEESYLAVVERIESQSLKQHLGMVFEADKYRLQAEIYHYIGPEAASKIVEGLEPGFTFEDFLIGSELFFDKKEEN